MTDRPRTRGVILAAGAGQRIGGPKALLRWSSDLSFLDRVASVLRDAGVEPLAVLGAEQERVRALHSSLECVVHYDWPRGQLSSAKAGMAEALRLGCAALLIAPVDVPTFRPDTARTLREKALAEPDFAWMPTWKGVRGHPLVLPASIVREILAMADVTSLEDALAKVAVRELPVVDEGILKGFNSATEYLEFFGRPPAWMDSK